MQTITATLLAAARSLSGAPAVSATLHPTRRGWTSLWQAPAAAPGKVAAVWVAGSPGALWRFSVGAGGEVLCQILDDPTDPDQWSAAWSTLNTDSVAGSDIAAAHEPGHWRLVYRNAAGAVRVIESADGVSWSAPATLTTPAGTLWLAAAGQHVLLLHTELDLYRRGWAGGAWAGPYRLPGGPWSLPYGVALAASAEDAANGLSRALYGVELRIRAAAFDHTTNTWATPRNLCPGADQAAPDDAAPRYPALAAVDGGYAASWCAGASGTPGWQQPIARWSRDGEHWGLEAPMLVESATPARLALAWDSDAGRLIASHGAAALLCAPRTVDDAAAALGPVTPARYRYRATATGARLELAILDPDGAYDPLTVETLAPLNSVRLWRGYVTSEGAETLALPPCYLVAAERSNGHRPGVVSLEAVDALGLLARRRPEEAAVYTDRSLAWLAAEVAALAGLTITHDGDAAWARTLTTFVVYPSRSLLAALEDLLRLAGAVARVSPEGDLRAHVLAGHTAETIPTLGELGEILAAGYGPALVDATGYVVASGSAAARAEDVPLGMALGWRALRGLPDARAETSALAAQAAAYALARLALAQRADHAAVPLRPELELWDLVDLYPSPTAEAQRRTVVSIEEVWEAGKGVFESRVGLG